MLKFIEEFYYGNLDPQAQSTEQLKANNQLEWVRRMNNIRQRATEIANNELIYT